MSFTTGFLFFLGMVLGGVLFEIISAYLFGMYFKKRHKKYHFFIGRYLYLLIAPFLAGIFAISQFGTSLITIFFSFALLGTILEWLIGFSYHQIVGKRLWTYYRFNISTYTSFLSIPLWGFAGMLFWLLAKIF